MKIGKLLVGVLVLGTIAFVVKTIFTDKEMVFEFDTIDDEVIGI